MKKNIIFIAIMIIAIANSINAQQMYGKWVIPTDASGNKATYELTFWSNGITSDSLDVTSNTYPLELSAGGFSDNYDLQFYILGNKICYGSDSDDWINPNLLTLFPEYQIIKCPGSTNKYFAFSSYAEYHEAMRLSYSTITYYPSTQTASALPPTPFREFDGGYGGFAISPKNYSPRYIYAASTESETPGSTLGGLYKWEITNDGLSQQSNPIIDASHANLSDNDFSAYNLEYKIDDNNVDVFAWIHGESNIENEIVIVIDDTPSIIDYDIDTVGIIGGIEFSAFEDSMLYASCDIGIIKINYVTGDIIQALIGNDYNKTFLQTAPDGHIYGVSNNGNRLGKIIQWGSNAGSFVDNAFIFPAYANVATFNIFDNNNYYILPENSNTYSALNVVIDTTDVSCPGASDGEVIIYVSGGVPFTPPSDAYTITCDPNINFTWDEDGYFEANNLWEDTYYYTITDDAQPIANIIEGQFIIDVDTTGYTYGEPNITIDSTYEWSNLNESYFHGFTILSGVELTITNSIIQFGANANIIIQSGAKLILNNSTLSDYTPCNDKWQGIQVWGIADQHQYSRPNCLQGKLVVQNGSVIENAVSAVELWKPNDYNSTGGIIFAYDSYFINNTKSIHAINYRNFNPLNPSYETGNLSYIKNCTFDVNSNYIQDQYTFYKHVDLAYVKGIDIEGCDFSLSATVGVSPWNIGIAAYDAGFRVLSICTSPAMPCTSYDSSSFTGFYNGIRATSGERTNNTFSVFTANFTNNSTGIYFSAVNNAVIVDCDFEIGYNTLSKELCNDNSYSYGIDVHTSVGFAIEENDFTKYPSADLGYYTGIRINNCRSLVDVIYKNNFDGLSYGNYAYGMNRKSTDDSYGVKYECNTNYDNEVDFIVTHEDENIAMIHTHHGIAGIQASGNTFSPNAQWHFRNEGKQNINWYYCDDIGNCPDQTPDPNLVMHNCTPPNDCFTELPAPEYNCPSHYSNSGDIKMDAAERQEVETDYAINLADYDNVKVLYDNLNDGGNTTAELLDIQTATPNDMWTLRAKLLGDSPHLSKEVLKEAADKTDVLPESVIFDIMAANPDEMKNAEMISYLENKDDPLPDYMISLLRQISNGSTYKTVLLHDMATYHTAKTQAAQDIIRSILSDSTINHLDYRNWLDNLGTLEADKQIINSYLEEGNTTSAIAMLNMLPALYELQGDDLDDYNDYKYLTNLNITLQSQGRNINQLNSLELNNIILMADSASQGTKVQARNILEYAYGYNYCDCQYISDATAMKSSNTINHNMGKAMGLSITAKPNPASNWAQFSYQLPYNVLNGEIIITDITGKFIDKLIVTGAKGIKLWDTRNMPKGVYLYTLNAKGFTKTSKIVIGN